MNSERNHQKTFYFVGDERLLRQYYVDQVCDCLGSVLSKKHEVTTKMVAGHLVMIGFSRRLNFFYNKKVAVKMPDGRNLILTSIRRRDLIRPVGV